MDFAQLQAMDSAYVMHTYGRFPVGIASGKNARCTDFDGKQYIDFTSGIGVNALGFCDAGWIAAVTAQLGKIQHISNLYYTEPCVQVAKILCERTGMRKVFFANSGAETNECAIKAARKYSFTKYGQGRSKIVSLVNSFHGRTVTTLAATGQDVFHNYFYPFTEGFVYAKANDMADTLAKVDGETCAVMLELIQGEGGVLPLDAAYVRQVADYCQAHDVLLIVDEVQTGVGRTGSLYAFEQFGIQPDIVTSAKGIGSGLPLGAVLFGEKTQGALQPGDHATTFGGNPIACAGAVEVLRRLDDAFLAQVKEKGAYMKAKLAAMPHVKDVAGMGLMLGVALEEGIASIDVVKAGIEKGVLALTAKAKVRLLPPLTITYEEIDEGLAVLQDVLSHM
nr:aspartate aminotransferase family protein [Maliibacterium massiliense]